MTRLYLREAQITYRRTETRLVSQRIRDSSVVVQALRDHIGSNVCESLVVLAVDPGNTILGMHEVSRGTADACPVRVADVFRYPLIVGAAGVILAHNHPSGSTEPSSDDKTLTKRVCEAGYLLGIPVLDHVIVTDTAHFSFLDAGLMPKVGETKS